MADAHLMNRSAIPRQFLVEYLDKGIAAAPKHALEGPKSVPLVRF